MVLSNQLAKIDGTIISPDRLWNDLSPLLFIASDTVLLLLIWQIAASGAGYQIG